MEVFHHDDITIYGSDKLGYCSCELCKSFDATKDGYFFMIVHEHRIWAERIDYEAASNRMKSLNPCLEVKPTNLFVLIKNCLKGQCQSVEQENVEPVQLRANFTCFIDNAHVKWSASAGQAHSSTIVHHMVTPLIFALGESNRRERFLVTTLSNIQRAYAAGKLETGDTGDRLILRLGAVEEELEKLSSKSSPIKWTRNKLPFSSELEGLFHKACDRVNSETHDCSKSPTVEAGSLSAASSKIQSVSQESVEKQRAAELHRKLARELVKSGTKCKKKSGIFRK